MKNIFIIVESDLRYIFFKRMHKSLIKLGYMPIYVTICPVVHYKAKKEGYLSYLIPKVQYSESKVDFSKTTVLEVKMREISQKGFGQVANQIWEWIEEIYEKYSPNLMFIYNGTTIFTMTASKFAIEKRIRTTFFELANLTNKMFIDSKGTNGYSRLYKDVSVLDDFEYNHFEFIDWKLKYKNEKKQVNQVKFGKNKIKDFCFYAINKLYFLSLLSEWEDRMMYLKKYVIRFYNRFISKSTGKYSDIVKAPYIFLPLQVSEDSQILLHSEIDNVDAIKIAHEEAKRLKINLVIKPHPAERNLQHIQDIMRLKGKFEFEMTMMDTAQLIANSKKVITINSTVALESILMGKDVQILGRSFYSHFINNEENLARYIMGYLVNIDYFSYENIEIDAVKKCIDRSLLGKRD